jgi:hypothetical protein
LKKLEIVWRNNEVKKTFLGTDPATENERIGGDHSDEIHWQQSELVLLAFDDLSLIRGYRDRKANGATMTTAWINCGHRCQ